MLLLGLVACNGSDPIDPPVRTPTNPNADEALVFTGDRPRNVLMVSIDTTRKDHVDRYDTTGTVRTPFLAGKLAEGVVLDDHQQCSNWTFGSTTCTLEGRMNEETGWVAKLLGDPTPVPAGRQTLAVRLQVLGWHTILVSSNDWLTTNWNNAQGYMDFQRDTTPNTDLLLNDGLLLLRAAVEAGADPWLLHVHLVQAHPPYTPPDPYDDEDEALPPVDYDLDSQPGQYDAARQWPVMTPDEQALLLSHLEARYTGELRLQDDQLAAWWETMDAEGWLDDTLVVFWTDHGEQFFERGNQAHAYDLGAEENDAVLGFWAKNLVPRAWDGPTHGVDLLPTVLDALEVGTTDELPGYVAGTAPRHRPRYGSSVARLGTIVTVTRDSWKLAYNFDGTVRLWDRATDPKELDDRYDPEDPLTLELWDLARARIDLLQPLVPEAAPVWPEKLPH